MCGIHVFIDSINNRDPPVWLMRRGPDHCGTVSVDNNNDKNFVCLQASVLQMRQQLVPQPFTVMPNQVYLAWNGEVYQRMTQDGSLEDYWHYEQSDTEIVARWIRQAITDNDNNDWLASLAALMTSLVNAEYAFCLLTPHAIYYGRDLFGRRSLLVQDDDDNDKSSLSWQLASVPTTMDGCCCWKEVEPGQVFSYHLKTKETRSLSYQSPKLNVVPLLLPTKMNYDSTSPADRASLQLQHLLLQAVKRRLTTCSIAILFSGGLDSVVLASLTLQSIPTTQPVTLVNVSFVDNDDDNNTTPAAVSADTLAAQASYQELQQIFPHHTIRFVTKQATWNDIAEKESQIRQLIHPKSTIMDLNIATALWFAADSIDTRVLLTGLGADEQMGGYGRHRKAFERGGNAALRKELDLDISRLWERNLGRDDRVLSDTAKEARFPFLDAAVVQFLQHQVPLEHVCDFSLPPGQGDKRILRLVAKRMGLASASVAVKRAIQFGSRIAHVSDKRRFGSRRKAMGDAGV